MPPTQSATDETCAGDQMSCVQDRKRRSGAAACGGAPWRGTCLGAQSRLSFTHQQYGAPCNPKHTCPAHLSLILRVVGSSVANSLSSASTPACAATSSGRGRQQGKRVVEKRLVARRACFKDPCQGSVLRNCAKEMCQRFVPRSPSTGRMPTTQLATRAPPHELQPANASCAYTAHAAYCRHSASSCFGARASPTNS